MSAQRNTPALARLAQVALGVSVFVFAWNVVAALRLTATAPPVFDATVASRTNASGAAGTAFVALKQTASDADVERAAAHDLFAPSREPVSARSGPGATPMATGVASTPGTSDMPALPIVKGTATGAAGDAFAMCALPGADAVVVRVGDVLGSYTVVSIERARVVFRDAAGGRHTVEANASPAGDER